eukprot:13502447-Heterocapsa_arctica.AAC.1
MHLTSSTLALTDGPCAIYLTAGVLAGGSPLLDAAMRQDAPAGPDGGMLPVSYTHLRAHETRSNL